MIDPKLAAIIYTTVAYGCGGSVIGFVLRWFNRKNPGPRLDQAAAIGAGIGAAFGAMFGIFQVVLS